MKRTKEEAKGEWYWLLYLADQRMWYTRPSFFASGEE